MCTIVALVSTSADITEGATFQTNREPRQYFFFNLQKHFLDGSLNRKGATIGTAPNRGFFF
jgi:hypothetical protein